MKAWRENLEYVVQEELVTMWLRHVAGFICSDHIVKPIFRLPYYRGSLDGARQYGTDLCWANSFGMISLYRLVICVGSSRLRRYALFHYRLNAIFSKKTKSQVCFLLGDNNWPGSGEDLAKNNGRLRNELSDIAEQRIE